MPKIRYSAIFLLSAFLIIIQISLTSNVNASIMHSTKVVPQNSLSTFNPLYGPRDIAIDNSGNIYIVDGDFNRVKKVSSTGEYITQWGTGGTGQKEFWGPFGIDIDSRGLIYVTDGANNRVQIFTQNGTFVSMFGTSGTGPGQFNYPSAIYIDGSDNVFITDTNNNRVQKFNRDGNFLMQFGSEGEGNGQFYNPIGIYVDSLGNIYVSEGGRVQVFDSSANYLNQFGNEVNAETQELLPSSFSSPNGITEGPDGLLYISDMNNHRVLKYQKNGTYAGVAADSVIDDTNVNMPHGLVFNADGNFVLANWGNNEVKIFTPTGTTVSVIAAHGDNPTLLQDPNDFVIGSNYMLVTDSTHNMIKKYDLNGNLLMTFGSTGSADGEFMSPSAIDIDAQGNIYVYDTNYRIQKFDSAGNFLMKFGSEGSGVGEFRYVEGISVDSDGNIFAADNQKYTIQKFNSSGVIQNEFGGMGYATGKLFLTLGLKVAPNGDVYVADGFNHRISVFDNNGNFITTFGGTEPENGGFSLPSDVEFDSQGNIYVMDPNGNQVHKFDSNYNHIESWGILGGRVGEMYYPYCIEISNTDEVYTLSPAPSDSGFVTKWNLGYQITNIDNTLDVRNTTGSLKAGSTWASRNSSENAEMLSTNYRVSDFTLDLTTDRDWSAVTAEMDINNSSAYIANLNPVDAPGVSASHSLYIPKLPNQIGVFICPNATSLADVSLSCAGGYALTSGDANVSVYVDGIYEFWAVSGLTGTGGLGLSVAPPTTRLTLTPNQSSVNTTQEVAAAYTPSLGFNIGDKIQFHFEPTAGFVLANTCATPTIDSDGDLTADGSGNIIGSDIYEYTFTDAIPAGALSFCISVTSPNVASSYSVRLTDDNGTFDNTMYYVGDDNDVFVIANVAPSLSFNIRNIDDTADLNTCSFGTVNASIPMPNYNNLIDPGLGECGYSIAVGTNASSGFLTQITADSQLDNGTSTIAPIANGTSFTPGNEAYGIANITQSSTGRNALTGEYTESITRNGVFSLGINSAAAIPTVPTNFISYNNGIQYVADNGANDVTQIIHGLVIGSGTPAGYYDQVITYTTTASF